MRIIIENIIKNRNQLEVKFSTDSEASLYINDKITPFYEYEKNIEEIPNSIAVIPFLCNILPMAFVLDAVIEVEEIDKTFFNSIDSIRKGYIEMAPMISYGGLIKAKKIVDNDYKCNKNSLLFSGGIDAVSSLVCNDDSIDELITIWGSDIKIKNEIGWEKMKKNITDTAKKFNKKWTYIKSNFREYINESKLNCFLDSTNDEWWHGFQHGIAIIGQVAPLSYLNGYSTVMIASSFTEEFNPVCASRPTIDNEIKYGTTITVHDGFDLDRCQKVKKIYDYIEKKNITLNIHVCWESDSGENCGICEKCCRTYLNVKSIDKDPNKIGVNTVIRYNNLIKMYKYKVNYGLYGVYIMDVIKRSIKETYKENIPKDLIWFAKTDFSKINSSFYWKLKFFYRRCKQKIKKILGGEKNG